MRLVLGAVMARMSLPPSSILTGLHFTGFLAEPAVQLSLWRTNSGFKETAPQWLSLSRNGRITALIGIGVQFIGRKHHLAFMVAFATHCFAAAL